MKKIFILPVLVSSLLVSLFAVPVHASQVHSLEGTSSALAHSTPMQHIEPFPGGYYIRDQKRDVTGQNLITYRNYWGISKSSYDSCIAKYGHVRANGRYVIYFDTKVQQRHIHTHIGTQENFRCWNVGSTVGMSLDPQ